MGAKQLSNSGSGAHFSKPPLKLSGVATTGAMLDSGGGKGSEMGEERG